LQRRWLSCRRPPAHLPSLAAAPCSLPSCPSLPPSLQLPRSRSPPRAHISRGRSASAKEELASIWPGAAVLLRQPAPDGGGVAAVGWLRRLVTKAVVRATVLADDAATLGARCLLLCLPTCISRPLSLPPSLTPSRARAAAQDGNIGPRMGGAAAGRLHDWRGARGAGTPVPRCPAPPPPVCPALAFYACRAGVPNLA